ncbi:MAG: hypothetical protein KF871_03485 [Hydrogenophaga sp.]|uniref:hypothetical protein n=1 Tax=Hydrogenophaga sp. TaxID=1904254 RepID=UPI001E05B2CF|nr:hypothetical protein [Hydrogenophaga sp.]MBX3608934.1 hypothetical protein [Hydrogenophaga sp.]
MVTNRHLDRLVESRNLAAFVRRHRMAAHNLVGHEHSGLLLTRGVFLIDISEALRDISVVISLVDARHRLCVAAEGVRDMCAQLGVAVPTLDLAVDDEACLRDAFLSNMDQKLHSLIEELPAVVALLNHVDGQGGLPLVATLAPAAPFHEHPYVRALPAERLAQYRMAVVLDPLH